MLQDTLDRVPASGRVGIVDYFLPLLDTGKELRERVPSINLTGMFLVVRATRPPCSTTAGCS